MIEKQTNNNIILQISKYDNKNWLRKQHLLCKVMKKFNFEIKNYEFIKASYNMYYINVVNLLFCINYHVNV